MSNNQLTELLYNLVGRLPVGFSFVDEFGEKHILKPDTDGYINIDELIQYNKKVNEVK